MNRLWQRFFGHGLVEPVDDMEKPAWNADLLDWLAEDFADHDYDVKHLIETMLTSQAYQLPAVGTTEQANTGFVFCGPQVRRMSAEQFRDAVGNLAGVWYEKPATQIIRCDGSTNGFVATRATLVAADTLQVALGRPNREQVVTERSPTATTLQALELTNGAELAALLARGAELTLSGQSADTNKNFVAEIFLEALGRKPTAKELRTARELVGQPPQKAGVEDLLWSLAMLPEFQLIY